MPGFSLWALQESFSTAAGMDLPAKHVENTLQSAEFWTNKVLQADRSAPSQVWASHLLPLLLGDP